MAVNISATRTSTLFNDQDGDGQFDPGDIITTRIRITVGPGDDALGVTVDATTNGLTIDPLDPNAVQVTPIAFDDFMPSITGNTPITFTAGQLLGNDVDPDGAEINLVISGVSAGTNGAIVNNGNGTFTFTPNTGYVGTASFQYTVTDEDGLASVSTGVVSFTVTDPVWYVDASYTGVNGASDGSYLKPFTTLANLSTGGSADALDNADDTIFVYNTGAYTTGIVLETGQKLFGDGHAFSVNGITIGANASNATIGHAGVGVTLATNNTIMGVTLNGTANGAVGIEDGGAGVGTLVVDETSITGLGKAVDIDQGGTLNVDLDQLSSASSTSEGIHLQGVTGTFAAATGIIQTSTGTGILIGAAGGGTASSGGDVNFTYGGDISSPGGSVVEIQDRTGGTVTFTGAITEGAIAAGQTGILVDGSAGTINFNGQTFVSAGAGTGNGVTLTNNSGTINFNPAGTGLDITTTSGTGLTFSGGGTLNITGAANSVVTGTGQALNLTGTMGTSGIAFQTLTTGNVAAGNAININNLDAAGAGTFSGGAVTIGGTAGAGADGINITGSNSTFNFASATIDNTAGDGIEINGTTPNVTGAVTFTTVNIDGVAGNGVNIVGATNAVNINGGTIGSTNDPAGDGVAITNGTGAVTVAASVTQSSGGNNVVDVSGHSGGAITFSGAITAAVGGGGIRLVNNGGGNIDFTGNTTLNTGSLSGITFTNTGGTGANVTFSEGTLDLDVTSGTGINATSTTVGAGSLTISGNDNFVNSTTGRAINIDGVTTNITLEQLGVSGGGTTTGVFLKNTGSGGQFVVQGSASVAGSGGTIANVGGGDLGSNGAAATQGTGIYMEGVSNVSLSNMTFSGSFGNFGIRGENVNNFTLRDSTLTGTFGTNEGLDEGVIRFGTENLTTGLKGTALFEGNNIAGGHENNLSVFLYGADTLNMTVRDSVNDQAVFGLNSNALGDDSLHVESGGTGSNLTLTVDGVAFNGARGDQLQTIAIGVTTQNLTITNNQFLNGHGNVVSGGGGVDLLGGSTAVGSNANITFNFSNNTIKGAQGNALDAVYTGHQATINGIIFNNQIGTNNGVLDTNANGGSINGGDGINVGHAKSNGTGSINYAVRIESNDIYDIKNGLGAIRLFANSAGGGGSSRLEATVKDNINGDVAGSDLLSGLYALVGGQGATDPSVMGLSVTGNTFRAGAASGGNAIYLDQLGSNTVAHYNIPGYNNAGTAARGENRSGGTASTALSTFWSASNTLVNGPFLPGYAPGKVDAGNTFGITNIAFNLPAPIILQEEAAAGWEDLDVSPVTAPPRDPEPAIEPSRPAGSEDGDMGAGGRTPPVDPGGNADAGAGTPSTPPASAGLTQAALAAMVDAAIQRWIDAGASAAQVEAMRAVQFGIVDMAGVFVGSSTTGVVNLDNDGAGYGWFVDSTPGEDSEFDGSGTRLTADSGGAAEGRIDLLTVLMHELGHQIGLGDEYAGSSASDLMYGYVNAGERRLPAQGEAAGGTPGSVGSTSYAITPVNIGTIPAGKTVDVFIKATITDQRDGFIVNLVNNATISGSNFTTQIAQEMLALDSLTLGSNVYVDANLNGLYDVGEGRSGVALQIYADTNDSGAWDAGDVLLGSATTVANGAYSFAGLAHGDYIVVVTAANFASGGALEGLRIVQGVAADPDNNVDNDNNGVAATGGAVASQTITLEYNQEPTAGTGNDVNNTLDFGFVLNQPPVANDDSVSVAEDSGANDLTAQLLSNDTDPENDTRTITSATQGANGTVSVVGGVLTYTPNGNYNGTDTFTYTISDGNGNTDTATANVTVTAVNDPVTGTAPANASVNEDSVDAAITGLSIADVDSTLAPSGVYDVTLSATQGTLTLTTLTGLTFTVGDGTGDTTMTFHGTLAAINTALATAKYTPTANYNGAAEITLQVTDTFGGIVATGTGAATSDSDTIAVTVNSVNDEPAGTDDSAEVIATIPYQFLVTDFSDGFSDPIDGDSFAGVRITTLPAVGTLKLNGVAIGAGDTITLAQLTAGEFTYEAPAAAANTSPTFTFQVQDDGGNANGGVEYDQSPNTFTLNVAPANVAPVLDLDASGAGTGYSGAYTEGGAAAAISDVDVLITDADVGDNVEGATITIANAVAGDVLTVVGTLPGAITVDPSSTATNLILTGTGTQAEYEAAIEQITFSSSSQDPTAGGTNTSRTINVSVTDGDVASNVAVSTISVSDDNADAPSGANATITAVEDTFRLIEAADLGFSDSDGTLASVTISAVTGGGIYFDADGTAGAGAPVLVVLPQTYTAQDLADGKVSFRAAPDVNGAGVGEITFSVTDDDGNTDASPNTLTVDVTAVNDSPILTTGGPIAATEQTAVAILPAGSVADVDLDARNGGNGDYAGASFSVNRNPATNPTEDVFTLVAGPNFTIDGSNLKAGGLIFGTISVNGSAGLIVVNFTSLETAATSALVDEVIQAVRYTNTSDNPPASVDLAVGFDDGSPGGGQGAGATNLDVNLVTVNIAGVNDAPVNSLGGTIGTIEDAVDAWLSGMSISDPDADPATDLLYYTFQVANGSLEIRTDVVGGIAVGDIIAQATDTITVQATLNQINATLAAVNGLTYSPNANFNGDDTLTVYSNDAGYNGSDPGLSGDGTSEEGIATRTISVQASDDAPVAQPDAVSTAENVIGTGSLFADNGSGPDSDIDSPTITVSEVNGSPADVGQPIVLASGAILTVNADGTYSYNPNGKFNRLTDGSSGAVNTSTVGDTFSYTVAGGNTVTVTVTVNGVAGPGDWLMGDGTDNVITGTPQPDTFVLSQGGNDSASGLDSDDIFYFGGALTDADNVNGGSGADTIVLQGDYSGGLTLDGSVVQIEYISMLAGTNVNFGDPGTNLYDYDLTISNSNFTGVQARINGSALLAGEDLTFDGSAETDSSFVIYGGRGSDDLTGGAGNDIFFFAEGGRFAAGDVVDGGDGYDGFFLRGNYSIDFTQAGFAGALTSIENLTVSGATDTRYARGGGTEFDYSITWDGDLLGAGQTLTVNGSTLGSEESLAFNGSDETNGNFRLFGGAG
ncbi:MAG TPA: Ig-like domain-containing protein, partial [Allosphingosinicella sp.]|nr:Ig-like domain-containing protein [Allosphingosinicella sp.]